MPHRAARVSAWRCRSSARSHPLRTLDGADLSAVAAAAPKLSPIVRFEPAHAGSGGHLQHFEHRAAVRIDPADAAFVALPGAVPELTVDERDAGHESIGLDRLFDFAGFGIDLEDLPAAILTNPERAFRPGQAGVAALSRRCDRSNHASGFGIDLLDAIFG